jgi:hypothetical protein
MKGKERQGEGTEKRHIGDLSDEGWHKMERLLPGRKRDPWATQER